MTFGAAGARSVQMRRKRDGGVIEYGSGVMVAKYRRRPRPRFGALSPSIFEEALGLFSVNTPLFGASVRASTAFPRTTASTRTIKAGPILPRYLL